MIRRGKGLTKTIGLILALLCTLLGAALLMLAVGFNGLAPLARYWVAADEKAPDSQTMQHTVMYDKNGDQFAEVWTEDRKEVDDLNKISPVMRDAMVSAEDKGFWEHGAIDVPSTLRSLVKKSGGGSGITQQLIKNRQYYDVNATDETRMEASAPTIARKLTELKMAMGYEKTHSKEEILLEYLNTVAIGAPNVYGVETASESLLGKKASDLTIAEAAALAGSVNNPSIYNLRQLEDKNVYDRVKQRQEYVLQRMLDDGKITRKQYDEAKAQKLSINIQPRAGDCGSSKYPFYCQYVMNYLQDYGALGSTPEDRARTINRGGLEIKTSLDSIMLQQLEDQIKGDWGVTNPKIQASAVVEPGTGHVLAIGANRDWGGDASKGQTQIVLADSPTQTGSTYKMMTLASALNEGYTEAQLNSISSACPWAKPGFDVPTGGIGNSVSCAMQGGLKTYRQATAYSSNTWFVELESRIGVEKVKEFSKSVGLHVPDEINPRSASFTLGVTDNSPIDMAAAYATFNAKGVYCPATPVTSITRMDGKPLDTPDDWDGSKTACRSVMSPHSASIVLKAQDANINGTDIPARFGAKAAIPGHHTVGKSGTTDSFANLAWTQTTPWYTVFSNAYDPLGNFSSPMTYFVWRGYGNGPLAEPTMMTTRDFIVTNLAGKPDKRLDLNNTDDHWQKVDVTPTDMITIPDVRGMSPDEALEAMKSIGLKAKVLKKTGATTDEKNNSSWPAGTIVKQSIEPGSRLVKDSKKIVELTVAINKTYDGQSDGHTAPGPGRSEDSDPQSHEK